ncbi:hypothetical protein [Lactiplantibacillus fabifermentans]|uniref:Cell surface protein n=1 Tax=Lactiplantibacillus fabifermentans T30PCM01 TaxID=1400520 RepID=W6T5Y1_9LACO|nr:hypothetical protein [Lactiplantibacillus fabifermentans]ETY73462.1 hypothetical protein LFAB_12340 [Lactiplantibacillus fabifermentans T30PCM01]
MPVDAQNTEADVAATATLPDAALSEATTEVIKAPADVETTTASDESVAEDAADSEEPTSNDSSSSRGSASDSSAESATATDTTAALASSADSSSEARQADSRFDALFYHQRVTVTDSHGAHISENTMVPSNTDVIYKFHYEHIPGTPAHKMKFDFRQKGLALKSYSVKMTGMSTKILKASGEHVTYEFQQPFDDVHNQIDIEVHGYVQRVKKRNKIPAGNASMSWNTGFLVPNWHSRDSPGFPRYTILPIGDIHMKVKETTINAQPHEPVQIEGFLAHDDSLRCEDVVVLLRRADGTEVQATPDNEDRFKLTVQPRDLALGANHLTLHAHCKGVFGSFPIDINIEVTDGDLKLATVSPTFTFDATTLTGEAKEIARQGAVKVEVEDTRHQLQAWQVTVANTEGLKNERNEPLSGRLVYKQSNQLREINATPQVIATDKVGNDADGKVDISDNWQNDSGILLQVNSDAVPGKYKGILNWAVCDVPDSR